jgi:hypothetical protein
MNAEEIQILSSLEEIGPPAPWIAYDLGAGDAEEAVNLVEGWKREKVYPFVGEPQNFIEQTERQIFDVVALSLNTYLPDFESADPKSKQLSLRLLKHTLEDSPTTVRKILQDVLDLPAEKQDEFAQLLERTSLSAIISASKAVADRLDFLKGLEMLVFDPENKKTLLERQQLQHILKDHTWIFGEEFHLSVDDQSLTEVLKKHLEKLGRPTVDPDPVVRPDGSEGIVDLMLSRLIPQTRQEHREHLIVELKRPSQPISNEIISQIRSYAFAVAEDERFRDVSTRWIFWAVSNTMTAGARKEARQANRPDGLLFESDGEIRIEVWAKSWGEIIDSCRARLQYFQQHLKYGVTDDSALEYLRKTHEKYLPESMTKPAEEVPPVDPVDQSGA